MALVSVVIPITSYEKELMEAIVSVKKQTFQDLEIVLVDNHATPNVIQLANQLVEENRGKIRLVVEEKKGAASARNRGIHESSSRYIALLDSDDRMKPIRIEEQLRAIRSDSEISLVGSWKDDISPDGNTIVKKDCRPDIPRWAQIIFRNSEKFRECPLYEPQTSSFFFEKEKAEQIGCFDERFDPYWLHDTFFVYRMYLIGKIYNVPLALSEQRMHTLEDSSRRVFDLKRIDLTGLFYTILKENHLVSNDSESQSSFRKLRSRWLREAGVLFLSYSKGEEIGRKLISRSLEEEPLSPRNWETYFRSLLPRSFQPHPCGKMDKIHSDLPAFVTKEWVENIFR